MDVDDMCVGCYRKPETTLHAIWNCPNLRRVRFSIPFVRNQSWNDMASAFDFFLFQENILDKKEMELMCVILWRCWWRRNQLIHNAGVRSEEEVVEWAENFLEEFHKTEKKISEKNIANGPMVKNIVRWERLMERVSKLIRMRLYVVTGILSALESSSVTIMVK
ncbi:hypothetical protein Dsin_031545 [Dipteronia sinensis]|uniref:Reverse transcriptase zinc-binding domain-containing protein n=1 Tax=Dipteronia sinensis TaxID=43782 RepID=A0AAD9ZN25_9ROSI|nr:hypothetical protein Dsin_031545 [Dipteronia sinensis]